MTLLFTGAKGFLGRNTIPILQSRNFEVSTLGQKDCDYNLNIGTEIPNFQRSFDIIFHAAGKAHIIPSNQQENEDFFAVNLQGTKNICEAIEKMILPKYFFFISTVAVYGAETGDLLAENEQLKGNTPYAKSKILAEEFLIKWCQKHNVVLYILRPSLIAGKNAPGNLGDMTKAIKNGRYANIAGGKAKKSIILAADFVQIIEKGIGKNGGIFNVSADENPDFYEISKTISSKLGKKTPINIPLFFIQIVANVGDILGSWFPINSTKLLKITTSLTFSNKKIRDELNFQPTHVLQNLEI
ncbi:NAD-dependent epimerase/dehydratase family protein [Frigoriflavimonas asaccharolytica]|uniref:Nucleoside-diphosphate-sugar epimerase n=1 Tax=Frigoriflavimonas asaccharolytica TaxID=2735899 RepID=A0A8J8G863_9FLAO|nr:NAD-dependent epimerase/dehydratase family protein [Frigoriflavimonas asaccharolytica]NRS91707.1 nucleoside-diphosphate-sugar epimerase [Frigoriflavimonas asaccharolytica]